MKHTAELERIVSRFNGQNFIDKLTTFLSSNNYLVTAIPLMMIYTPGLRIFSTYYFISVKQTCQ